MHSSNYTAASKFYQQGNYREMVELAVENLKSDPSDGYLHYLAAVGMKELGLIEEAVRHAKSSIRLTTDASNARLLLATLLRQLGKFEDAECEFKALRNEFPAHEVVASNYAYLLNDLKRFDESIEVLRPFVQGKSASEATTINIGNAYRGLGDIESAKRCYQAALALNGKYAAGARANMAVIAMEEGRLLEAKAALAELAENGVAPPEAYLNLAIIASRLGATEDAIRWVCEGESKGLDGVSAVSIYALAQAKLGNPTAAIDKIRSCLNTGAQDFMLLCVWLGIAQKFCLFDELRHVRPKILEAIKGGCTVGVSEVNLFALLACSGVSPWQHLKLAQQVSARLRKDRTHLPLANQRKKKLRVGYLCADFRDHPVAHLMMGVFKTHDRNRFEIVGYNVGKQDESIYRYRAIGYLDEFHDVADFGFLELATRIAGDEIDVLVDLVGYTENCKPQVLLYKPAPVIIGYLGYVGTTGLDVVDYVIADRVVLPEEYKTAYSECPIYLPRCFQSTDSTLEVERVGRLEFGLPEEAFVFAAFNNSYKINDEYVALWSQILSVCGSAILWVFAENGIVKENIRSAFERYGVEASRIVFFERQSKKRFLGALACADLFLDTSPYNAGTTASDALYAGCPVITVPGAIYSARMAASILVHAGLAELVCNNEGEYVHKAISMYSDREFRGRIRAKVVGAKESRLFDTADATKSLELAYDAAYERYLNGLSPDAIDIEDYGWVREIDVVRPYSSLHLSIDEVRDIGAKLVKIGGEPAVLRFHQFISPVATSGSELVPPNDTASDQEGCLSRTVGRAIAVATQDQSFLMELAGVDESNQVLNFFNPVFWGVKDPEVFGDLMRMAAKQTSAYHFADNMFVFQRNNSMLHDRPFMESWGSNAISGSDKAIIWRRYVLAVAGYHCAALDGDFVECGAYQGVGAKTVLDYLGGRSFGKKFWLYDVFEHDDGMVNHAMPGHGPKLYDEVRQRFHGYSNVNIYKGILPSILGEASPEKIAYLHIDLNQAPAEIGTLDVLFDRVVPGGIIILDDYEMFYYRAQKYAEDDWFGARGYKVIPLPTSQGLVIKR